MNTMKSEAYLLNELNKNNNRVKDPLDATLVNFCLRMASLPYMHVDNKQREVGISNEETFGYNVPWNINLPTYTP